MAPVELILSGLLGELVKWNSSSEPGLPPSRIFCIGHESAASRFSESAAKERAENVVEQWARIVLTPIRYYESGSTGPVELPPKSSDYTVVKSPEEFHSKPLKSGVIVL
jgi:hypothetical protein